ncbi:hypothetical protein LZ32DRAFT_672380 [Colletotrichum eremochloae]|nr:hypothetical protein LZ32DRAFT_672380 [Colletotrichum eremochloae]
MFSQSSLTKSPTDETSSRVVLEAKDLYIPCRKSSQMPILISSRHNLTDGFSFSPVLVFAGTRSSQSSPSARSLALQRTSYINPSSTYQTETRLTPRARSIADVVFGTKTFGMSLVFEDMDYLILKRDAHSALRTWTRPHRVSHLGTISTEAY